MLDKYIFIILTFIFTLGQLDRVNLTNGVVIHVTDVLVLIVVVIGFYRLFKKNQSHLIIVSPLFKAVIIFSFFCFLSLIINPLKLSFSESLISSLYLVRWVSYASIYFVVNSFGTTLKNKIFKCFIFSQLILLIGGYIQYFYYPDLRNLYYLGWDEHLYRMFSTFMDPNFAAVQFSLFLFLLTALLISGNQDKFRKVILSVIIILTFIGLLLTYSRAGYIMGASGITCLLWLMHKKKLIILFLAVLIFGIVIIPKDMHSAGVELWRTASIRARSISALQAMTIIKDHLFFGVGFNSYRFAQLNYGFLQKNNWELSHSGAGTDNSYLFLLATTGILGLIAYLNLMLVIIKKISLIYYKNINRQKVMAGVILASIFALSVNSLFLNSLFYPYTMFWMWTMIAIGDNRD